MGNTQLLRRECVVVGLSPGTKQRGGVFVQRERSLAVAVEDRRRARFEHWSVEGRLRSFALPETGCIHHVRGARKIAGTVIDKARRGTSSRLEKTARENCLTQFSED
jgi:hypothetical protein